MHPCRSSQHREGVSGKRPNEKKKYNEKKKFPTKNTENGTWMKNETEIWKYHSKVSTGISLFTTVKDKSPIYYRKLQDLTTLLDNWTSKPKQLQEHFIMTSHHEIILTTICPTVDYITQNNRRDTLQQQKQAFVIYNVLFAVLSRG